MLFPLPRQPLADLRPKENTSIAESLDRRDRKTYKREPEDEVVVDCHNAENNHRRH